MEDGTDDGRGPHEEDSTKYLKEHKIIELFENLTAALVYERPEDPKMFVKNHIEQLQKAKSDPDLAEPPCFIDESNLRSIFHMLDITKKGYISCDQYLKAMANMRVSKFNPDPAGAEFNRISLETFVHESKAALRNASATFID